MRDHLYSILRMASQLHELSVSCQLSTCYYRPAEGMLSYFMKCDRYKQRWLTPCCDKNRLRHHPKTNSSLKPLDQIGVDISLPPGGDRDGEFMLVTVVFVVYPVQTVPDD